MRLDPYLHMFHIFSPDFVKNFLIPRRESGIEGIFRLDSPATSERIRMACVDQFTKQVRDTIHFASTTPPVQECSYLGAWASQSTVPFISHIYRYVEIWTNISYYI